MRKRLLLFRLTASMALAALLSDAILPRGSAAQPAPPPLPEPDQAQPSQSQADPPARVGRVARMSGSVSFRTENDDQWTSASLNYPVSTGNAFWTEPSASAELEISDSRITLAGTTELDIATLDSDGLKAVAAQGEAYFHLHDLGPAEAWSVQTPRGLVRLTTPGRYNISVGSTEQPTRVTVLEGSAQIDGPNVSLQVAVGQTATIDGTSNFEGSVGPMVRDPFLIARLDAEQPKPAAPAPLPQQVAAMPGGSDLTGVGTWSEAPEYGPVWYPPVSSGWLPYREGRWAFIAPWGWTWIDDAPWGFAPFHYGRWIEIGGRWCWTPGRSVQAGLPVYAPALVAFVGLGAGVALGAALASHSIGWVPLGPRESFRPWYHASDRYSRAVNINQVTNINNVTVNTFINQQAATAIPGSDMARSRPVQSVARPMTTQEFAAGRPIIGQHPIRPTAETAGMTPAAVRAFNLPLATVLPAAPGPVVHLPPAGTAGTSFIRPLVAPSRPIEPGGPGIRSVAGSPPFRSGRAQVPSLVFPDARSPSMPVHQPGQRPQMPPAVIRGTEPNSISPGGIAPGLPRPGVGFVPGPVVRSDPRPLPQVITPTYPRQQNVLPPPAPLPHQQPPPQAPMPRVAAPAPIPHFEPHRVVPHQQPPPAAAPAARPEPPRPAGLPSAFRPNRPGER